AQWRSDVQAREAAHGPSAGFQAPLAGGPPNSGRSKGGERGYLFRRSPPRRSDVCCPVRNQKSRREDEMPKSGGGHLTLDDRFARRRIPPHRGFGIFRLGRRFPNLQGKKWEAARFRSVCRTCSGRGELRQIGGNAVVARN